MEMELYGWLIDPKRCIECRACESACKQWNQVDTGLGLRYRLVRISESGTFPNVQMQAITNACNHCENALCMKACPVKAIWRRNEDGAVLVDREKCVGCQECRKFCPYLAPQYDPRTRKMQKCTMCFDRVENNLKPACASLCPTGALKFGPWKDIMNLGSAEYPGMPTPNTTKPRLRFVTEGYPVK
jgi:anaerobic dimethyl sulfoxide reductase subunit B (iron-sulfur subunit)